MIHVNKLGTGNKSGSDANNKMPIQTSFDGLPDNSAATVYADDYSDIEYMYRGTGRVTFRAKDGERVILYHKIGLLVHKENCLNISSRSKGVKFINIEISGKQTNYDKRTNPGLHVSNGVLLDGTGNELRNIIIHDVAGVGITAFGPGPGRIYRAIVYYSGYVDETGKSRGHNAYFQQFDSGLKEFVDMFLFGGMRRGGQTYGEKGGMKNIRWIRPVVYQNGSINPEGSSDDNFIVGGLGNDSNIEVLGGVFYRYLGSNFRAGYNSDTTISDSVFRDNFVIGAPLKTTRPVRCVFENQVIIAQAGKPNVRQIEVDNLAVLKENKFINNTYYSHIVP